MIVIVFEVKTTIIEAIKAAKDRALEFES